MFVDAIGGLGCSGWGEMAKCAWFLCCTIFAILLCVLLCGAALVRGGVKLRLYIQCEMNSPICASSFGSIFVLLYTNSIRFKIEVYTYSIMPTILSSPHHHQISFRAVLIIGNTPNQFSATKNQSLSFRIRLEASLATQKRSFSKRIYETRNTLNSM